MPGRARWILVRYHYMGAGRGWSCVCSEGKVGGWMESPLGFRVVYTTIDVVGNSVLCLRFCLVEKSQACQDFYSGQTCRFTLVATKAFFSLEAAFAWSTPNIVAHSHRCASYFGDTRVSR